MLFVQRFSWIPAIVWIQCLDGNMNVSLWSSSQLMTIFLSNSYWRASTESTTGRWDYSNTNWCLFSMWEIKSSRTSITDSTFYIELTADNFDLHFGFYATYVSNRRIWITDGDKSSMAHKYSYSSYFQLFHQYAPSIDLGAVQIQRVIAIYVMLWLHQYSRDFC